MTLAVSAGWRRGIVFLIEEKRNGEVKATVNKRKQTFGTWAGANQWIEDEVKRSYNGK